MADRELTLGTQVDTAAVLEGYVSVLESSEATIRDEADLPFERAMIKDAILEGLKVAGPDERDPLEQAFLALAYFQPLTEEEGEAVAAFDKRDDEEETGDVARTLAWHGEVYSDVLRRVERDSRALAAELGDRDEDDDDEDEDDRE